jgi:hypothetical protein
MRTSLSRLAFAGTFVVVVACAGGWPATQAAGSAVDTHAARISRPGFAVGRVVETVRRNRLKAVPRPTWHGRRDTAPSPEAGPRSDPPSRRFSDPDIPLTGLTVSRERPASEPFHVPAIDYQEYPRVARAGNVYLVVWADWRGTDSVDVFGARVTTQGEILDPAGIAISLREDDQYMPTVASDGEDFLVAWENYADDGVYGARVTEEGVVQDLDPIRISGANPGGYLPSLAWDGTNYLVAWGAWSGDDIYGARVSPGGTVLDETAIQISTAPGTQWAPSVAYGRRRRARPGRHRSFHPDGLRAGLLRRLARQRLPCGLGRRTRRAGRERVRVARGSRRDGARPERDRDLDSRRL